MLREWIRGISYYMKSSCFLPLSRGSYSLGLSDRRLARRVLFLEGRLRKDFLLDLEQNLLHAFRHPKEGVYTERRTFLPGEEAEPLAFPGVRIAWA
jgi:hypothetical protein